VNHFLALAERQISAPVKRRIAAAEAPRQDKAEREREALAAHFVAWRAQRLAALRSGPYSDEIAEIDQILERLTTDTIPNLAQYVCGSRLVDADCDTRHGALSLIGAALARTREEAGLEPFDDGLPDQVPDAFILVREALR
jgi:hypothetical protein